MRIVLLLILFSLSLKAQTVEIASTLQKGNIRPVVLEKVRLEVSLGASISHLNKYARTKPLISPYAELGVSIPLDIRVRLVPTINYQVFGSKSKYSLPVGEATAIRQVPYLSMQVTVSYLVSKITKPHRFELQGGIFGAKKLDDVTINRIPNQPISRSKSINSTVDINYGLVVGATASTKVNQRNRLGIRLLFQQGILDIRPPIAKQYTGDQTLRTQALTLSTYISL